MATVQEFIDLARFQLQDQMEAYRYSDANFIMGLNVAFDEAYRLRPDMFIRQAEVTYTSVTDEVVYPRGYKMAFVYYMCGFIQLSDEEDTTDARAGSFLSKFMAQLTQTPA
jgi:hypothetical protein